MATKRNKSPHEIRVPKKLYLSQIRLEKKSADWKVGGVMSHDTEQVQNVPDIPDVDSSHPSTLTTGVKWKRRRPDILSRKSVDSLTKFMGTDSNVSVSDINFIPLDLDASATLEFDSSAMYISKSLLKNKDAWAVEEDCNNLDHQFQGTMMDLAKSANTPTQQSLSNEADEQFSFADSDFFLKSHDQSIDREESKIDDGPVLGDVPSSCLINDRRQPLPDDSMMDTIKNEQLVDSSGDIRQDMWHQQSLEEHPVVDSSQELVQKKSRQVGKQKKLLSVDCQVCGDAAAGYYCGAFVCEACKKFYMRACKQDKVKYVCLRDKKCEITKESRVQCQYCRYQRCLALHMFCPGSEGDHSAKESRVSDIPCSVCGSASSGFHFGALTCEGCKGFFRRMAKEREPERYQCVKKGSCEINTVTRNICKSCRYRKCLEVGMSIEGSRIGRQPNSVKHAISLVAKKIEKTDGRDSGCIMKENLFDGVVIKTEPGLSPQEDRSCVFSEKNSSAFLGEETLKDGFIYVPCDAKSASVPICRHDSFGSTSNMPTSRPTPVVTSVAEPVSTQIPEKVCEMDCEEKNTWNLIDSIVDAGRNLHLLNYRIFRDEDMKIIQSCKPDELIDRYSHLYMGLEENRKRMMSQKMNTATDAWTYILKNFEQHSYCIIKFVKKLPGFKKLCIEDQVKLIQTSAYPVVLLNLARVYNSVTKFFNYFNFTVEETERILDLFPMFRILPKHFLHVGEMARLFQFTEEEYALLSAIILFPTDISQLNDPKTAEELQLTLVQALQFYEEKTHEDGSTRFGVLLTRIGELTVCLLQHNQAIKHLIIAYPYMQMSQLFKETILQSV
ncbi:hypothetical protein CHS0354_015746 [Potamilus streckersoni]|uniref:Uncharacterized protein n=1 Tax=Potamilus streckersoni TaxID=2493646 RepID=A0AAE0T3F1_9BIVA|nr:hypothetical protein CHS0354_015746 [Potamilus streckersoni]